MEGVLGYNGCLGCKWGVSGERGLGGGFGGVKGCWEHNGVFCSERGVWWVKRGVWWAKKVFEENRCVWG